MAETKGVGGARARRGAKGKGAERDQRRLEDGVLFMIKQARGGSKAGGRCGVRLETSQRQPGAPKDGQVDTTFAEGTWLHAKKGKFCSQRN